MISAIKKFTNKILKCKPDAWSTRWPWVLCFGLLVHLVLGALVLLTEWDVRYSTQYEIWISFITIIMLLAVVFHLIYLLRFNVFKRFGKLSPWHYVGTFLTYLGTMALIVSWGYNPSFVTSATARVKYDEKKVAKDLNRINVLINTLEHDSIPHLWTRRKVILDTVPRRHTNYQDNHYDNYGEYYDEHYEAAVEAVAEAADAAAEYANDGEYLGYIVKTDSFYIDKRVSRVDSLNFYDMLANDSIRIINDTSIYRFYCADYNYIMDYHEFFNERTEDELSKEDLFQAVVREKPIIKDREAMAKELRGLIETYWAKGHGYRYGGYYALPPGEYEPNDNRQPSPKGYREYISNKYKTADLNEGVRNVSKRYYMWKWYDLGFLFYPLYYISMALALLLFLFRHNRKKSFFYTILAGVVIFIATATFIALAFTQFESLLVIFILYMVVFGIIAFTIFRAKRKSMWQDIAKNLFIYFIPLLPLIVTALYYEIKKSIFESNHDMSKPEYSKLYAEAFKYQDDVMLASQFFGFFLFIILLHFVFSKMLRKSYALPEN